MNENETWNPNDELINVSNFLASAALGLFLIFIGVVLSGSLPLQFLQPSWQLQLTNRFVSSGIMALLGLALLHIAIVVNPANNFLRQRLHTARHLAIAAAIGFLLLIPLQGYATWRVLTNVKIEQSQALKAGNKRLTPLKKAINEATSITDLQRRLAELKVNLQLQPSDLTDPLPALKQRILANLDRAEITLRDRNSGIKPEAIWSAAQSGVVTIFSSLGFALAFAAGAQAPNASETLLESVSHRWARKSGSRRRRKLNLPFPTEET